MVSKSTKWARRLRRKLKKEWGNVCNYPSCNETKKLEFAHICPTCLNGMGRGSTHRVKDVRDNPHAYTLLCKQHHLEYDSKVV